MKRQSLFTICIVLALAVTLIGTQPVSAQTVVATILMGDVPFFIAVNPSTNLIYATYQNSNTVSVIDGTTNTVTTTLTVGNSPEGIAVNPSTNRIYVANHTSHTMSVIDGTTNTILASVPVTPYPFDLAVNPITNRIYVVDFSRYTVSVIDGTTNVVVATVPVGSLPLDVAVNSTTNRIYVTNTKSNSVLVIDGNTNAVVTTVSVGNSPYRVAVNPNTNRIYVTNAMGYSVSVIDGSTNTIVATVPLGVELLGVAVSPNTNRIYVDRKDNSVSVMDGITNAVLTTVSVGSGPYDAAVNSGTNRIYVTNVGSKTISVIHDPANEPPIADANGPYSVNEGGSVTVTASGTDPEGGQLSYAWDLDNDGTFETAGQSVTFSAANLDGPSTSTINVQVTDEGGLTATAQATVDVLNVAPTATFTSTPATLLQGQSTTLAFNNPFDPGVADTAASFQYSYDCTNDGTFELASASDASYVCAYPTAGTFNALGRIADKDGGFTDYTVPVKVLTPREGAEGLIDQVQALIPGTLNEGQGQGLIVKLQAAIAQLDQGKVAPALNQLEAFINDVNADISSGKLTLEEGQPLLDAADAIIAALGG